MKAAVQAPIARPRETTTAKVAVAFLRSMRTPKPTSRTTASSQGSSFTSRLRSRSDVRLPRRRRAATRRGLDRQAFGDQLVDGRLEVEPQLVVQVIVDAVAAKHVQRSSQQRHHDCSYSSRNATIGSTEAARRAGTMAAIAPTTRKPTTGTSRLAGSSASTS